MSQTILLMLLIVLRVLNYIHILVDNSLLLHILISAGDQHFTSDLLRVLNKLMGLVHNKWLVDNFRAGLWYVGQSSIMLRYELQIVA